MKSLKSFSVNLFLLHSWMSVLVISPTACRVAQLNNWWSSHCNSISHQRGQSHTGVTTERDHQRDSVSPSLVKENESSSRCNNVTGEEKKKYSLRQIYIRRFILCLTPISLKLHSSLFVWGIFLKFYLNFFFIDLCLMSPVTFL